MCFVWSCELNSEQSWISWPCRGQPLKSWRGEGSYVKAWVPNDQPLYNEENPCLAVDWMLLWGDSLLCLLQAAPNLPIWIPIWGDMTAFSCTVLWLKILMWLLLCPWWPMIIWNKYTHYILLWTTTTLKWLEEDLIWPEPNHSSILKECLRFHLQSWLVWDPKVKLEIITTWATTITVLVEKILSTLQALVDQLLILANLCSEDLHLLDPATTGPVILTKWVMVLLLIGSQEKSFSNRHLESCLKDLWCRDQVLETCLNLLRILLEPTSEGCLCLTFFTMENVGKNKKPDQEAPTKVVWKPLNHLLAPWLTCPTTITGKTQVHKVCWVKYGKFHSMKTFMRSSTLSGVLKQWCVSVVSNKSRLACLQLEVTWFSWTFLCSQAVQKVLRFEIEMARHL